MISLPLIKQSKKANLPTHQFLQKQIINAKKTFFAVQIQLHMVKIHSTQGNYFKFNIWTQAQFKFDQFDRVHRLRNNKDMKLPNTKF